MWHIAYLLFFFFLSLGSQFRNVVPLRNRKEASEYFFVFDSTYSNAILLWIQNTARFLTPQHSLLTADPYRKSCNVTVCNRPHNTTTGQEHCSITPAIANKQICRATAWKGRQRISHILTSHWKNEDKTMS